MTDTATATPPASEPEVLDASKLLDGRLAEEMPEANEAAIAAEESKIVQGPTPVASPPPAAPTPNGKGATPLVDELGRTYDRTIHQTDRRGKPILRTNGKLKIRPTPLREARTTSKVATEAEAMPTAPDPAVVDTPPEVDPAMAIKAGAATCAGTQLLLMRTALGDKIGSEDSEREELVRAWEAVFRHYGFGGFHPVVGLAMVSGGMVVAAMKHKETQTALQKFTHWLQHKWLSFWQWTKGRRDADAEAMRDSEPQGA